MKKSIAIVLVGVAAGFAVAQPSAASAVHLRPHSPPAQAAHCQDCHAKKANEYISSKTKTLLSHETIHEQHGRVVLSCGSCHDRNRSNQLRISDDPSVSFTNPSPVCKQCHQDRFLDWQKGLHGKRTGGWSLDQEQLNCIDCHSPHSVRFKIMKASPPPVRPKFESGEEAHKI